MADEPKKVLVQASRIDASILPPGFTLAYKLYVIQQTSDLKNISDATNNANELAYEATIKNQEQDVELADHEKRIQENTSAVAKLEVRVNVAEGNIQSVTARIISAEGNITALQTSVSSLSSKVATAQSDIENLKGRTTTNEGKITAIQNDYVSKSATGTQSISSPVSVATSLSVNGTKVIGARVTGWTASTGSSLPGAFNSNDSYPVSASYVQGEIQDIAFGVRTARQRIKALEDAMRAHGLIN